MLTASAYVFIRTDNACYIRLYFNIFIYWQVDSESVFAVLTPAKVMIINNEIFIKMRTSHTKIELDPLNRIIM